MPEQELTPEQRVELQTYLNDLNTAEGAPQGQVNQPAPQAVPQAQAQIQLSDGRTLPADQLKGEYERLQGEIQRLEASPAPAQAAPPAYVYEDFAKKFVDDPYAGLSYLNKAKLGYDPNEIVPKLYEAIVQGNNRLAQVENQLTTATLNEIEGFESTPENKAVLDRVLQARNLTPNPQSYRDAVAIARAEGQLQSQMAPAAQQIGQTNGLPAAEVHNPVNNMVFPQSGLGNPAGGAGGATDGQLLQQYAEKADLGDLREQALKLQNELQVSGQIQ